MIVTSTCDPAVFDSNYLADENYSALLELVLMSMEQNHLTVVDEAGAIFKATQQKLLTNPNFQVLYGRLLDLNRIVRVPVSEDKSGPLASWIDQGSVAAVDCSEIPLVDCLVASNDTLTAMAEVKRDGSKATSVQKFPSCKWCGLGGAKQIGGMTKEQFLSEIIRPVVRCAKKVTIIDKQIIKAAFGDGSQARSEPSGNWPSFKKTIQAIYIEWMRGMHKGKGLFEVITLPVSHVRKNNKPILENELAAAFRKKLKFPYPNVRVMLKREKDFREDMHDRYLVTDKGFMLGFTKGFDLSSKENMGTCVVYLMKPDNLISRIMSPTGNYGTSTSKADDQ